MTHEGRFLEALPTIDQVTAHVCRRHRLTAAEEDDFRSEVHMHFIDRDYEVLRRFEGRSSLASYVSVVVQNLFLDRRNKLWGRWRPSTEARRIGPTGVLLERLVCCDGWTSEQALELLRTNHGVEISDALAALCEKLAARGPSRRFVAEEEAGEIVTDGPSAEANVVRAEQDFLAKRVQAALDRARQALAPAEKLILKMHFEERVLVADIARALHLNQRRLYRTIERVLGTIRAQMEADGIAKSDIAALFADETFRWSDEREAEVAAGAGAATPLARRGKAWWLQGQ